MRHRLATHPETGMFLEWVWMKGPNGDGAWACWDILLSYTKSIFVAYSEVNKCCVRYYSSRLKLSPSYTKTHRAKRVKGIEFSFMRET